MIMTIIISRFDEICMSLLKLYLQFSSGMVSVYIFADSLFLRFSLLLVSIWQSTEKGIDFL